MGVCFREFAIYFSLNSKNNTKNKYKNENNNKKIENKKNQISWRKNCSI